jgi:hypothetical protein
VRDMFVKMGDKGLAGYVKSIFSKRMGFWTSERIFPAT